MTDDRFDARLRQHLVLTANERPAEGQLAAVFQAVSATPQRSAVVAGLTLFPGRLGPIPIRTLRLVLVAAALALATIVGAVLMGGGSARPASTVFEGRWTSTDPGDGSTQVLLVAPGTSPAVRYTDLLATGGACIGAQSKVFTADGSGTIQGDVLSVEFPDGGGCGAAVIEVGPGEYTYHEATDTLTDATGVTWQRDGDPMVPPSLDPATPSPSSAPSPSPADTGLFSILGCVPLSPGSTYTGAVDSVVITASAPGANGGRWNGLDGSFGLLNTCVRGPAISIGARTIDMAHLNSCVIGRNEVAVTFADVVASLSGETAEGVSKPVRLTIGGHDAVRFDVDHVSGCAGGFGLQGGAILGEGESGSIFVVDLDGVVISFELNVADGFTPEQVDEARSIVAGLRLERAVSSPAPAAS